MFIIYNPDHHPLGKNIRLLRKKYFMSVRTLARLLDIEEHYLKEIEAGTTRPEIYYGTYNRLMEIFPIPEGKDIFFPDLFD